ncbi:pseudaminic acid synthase [Marinobacterium jannaschii]|uniref:pseudaminic acid synthase n=1 Tax=Marinobacterium jannaschii TaxID=64970 RepID=UPI00048A0EBC|nr:pseudaminic acid synthase [Marinobacterium jannaschii]
MTEFSINGRQIGGSHPPYVIAELSANHNGDLQRALDTIAMAAKCGADAIKIQSYTADSMTIDSSQPDFMVEGGLWDGFKLYDLYKWAQTPYEWHKPIFDFAAKQQITIFSTPFDEAAVDMLEDLNAPAYKIASFESTDLPLISYAASTGKPLIISTGMANLEEIQEAISTARESGCNELAILHCVSGYPSPVNQANLSTISDMSSRFDTVIGLSDHTIGNLTAIAATALGASIIEKHFTLSRSDKGPDSEFSLEPDELSQLVQQSRQAFDALGQPGYELKPAENSSIKFRRSLYFVKDLKAGDTITEAAIRRIRPGYGIAPKYLKELIGRKVARDIAYGTSVQWEDIEP